MTLVGETYTVADLCHAVGATIDERFDAEVWVTGAISGLKRPPNGNGHVYFDLVEPSDDPGATGSPLVPVALFASARQRVNAILRRTQAVRMHDGVEIRIRGRVTYYPPQGRVQLVMSLIDPAYTLGRMVLARQALVDELRAEGLLGANGSLEMPALPLRVGLVTSRDSAAHADFAHQVAASGYAFHITVHDARVQGADAAPSLAEAIGAAGRSGVDVVVVIRGGGARSDLAAFDHARVARAIASCPRPVIVGVGHEIDRSVADEVAAMSVKTPTAAAAVLVDAARRFDAEVTAAADRLISAADRQLHAAGIDLVAAAQHLTASATRGLDTHAARLDTLAARLDLGRQRTLERAGAALDTAQVRLRALDPAAALARGWTITHTADGTLVRSADDVEVGTTLITTTATGRLVSTVTRMQSPQERP